MIPKLKRTISSLLPVESVRTGSCNGCGDCCKLPYRCTFLQEPAKGEYRCSIYQLRPPNCRKFPRSFKQWEEVKENCGFKFDDPDGDKK